MTLRLQNLMLAMLLALTTLFVGFGTLSQNPTSGGYQLFERVASGISADIQLALLGNFAPPPETASEYANAPNRGDDFANPGTRPGATDAEAGGASYYDQYRKADGSGWDWPENLGFAGTPTEATMPVGTRLDRYGSADGSFMSPAGTPLEQRAMAPGSAAEPLRTYEVAKPLPVIQGEVAPAFGQSGGGTQMLPNLSERVNVDWLVRNGYLKEVN